MPPFTLGLPAEGRAWEVLQALLSPYLHPSGARLGQSGVECPELLLLAPGQVLLT